MKVFNDGKFAYGLKDYKKLVFMSNDRANMNLPMGINASEKSLTEYFGSFSL